MLYYFHEDSTSLPGISRFQGTTILNLKYFLWDGIQLCGECVKIYTWEQGLIQGWGSLFGFDKEPSPQV